VEQQTRASVTTGHAFKTHYLSPTAQVVRGVVWRYKLTLCQLKMVESEDGTPYTRGTAGSQFFTTGDKAKVTCGNCLRKLKR
jgi:hypothetical protein